MTSLESDYEKALRAASPGLTWSWKPSPISAGWTDLILHVAGIGDVYAGAHSQAPSGSWYGGINYPNYGSTSFSQPTEAEWRAMAIEDLVKRLGPSPDIEIKRWKKLVADWKRWKKYVAFVKANEAKLASQPHPFSWQAKKGLTMLDYVTYLLVAPEAGKWKRAYDEAAVAVSKK